MRYAFELKKNVFMYNHLLIVSDGQECYEAVIESLPTEHETMVIWLEDFKLPEENTNEVKAEMTKWFIRQNIACIFNDGKGR